MHAARAWVHPCAIVRFVEEGGERGELIRLKERPEAAAGGVDVREAVRTNRASTLVTAVERTTPMDALPSEPSTTTSPDWRCVSSCATSA